MNLSLIDNQIFTNQNYTTNKLITAEYSYCTFTKCNFENSDLSNNTFLECEFVDCNLSNVNVMHTTFNDVVFIDSKLVGILFQNCNDFLLAINFKNCSLNLSAFYQLRINNTKFLNCKMNNVDFTEAQATKTIFHNCDLKDAIFDQTNLAQADLSSAFNFSINPSNNQLKNAHFSKDNCYGLLTAFNIIIK